MLPRATHERTRREAAAGKQIGPHPGDPAPDRPLLARGDRALGSRRAPDHHRLRCAPGRWRHAHRRDHRRLRRACTGASRFMTATGLIARHAIKDHVAAVSCGIYEGTPVLDLDYAEDSGRAHRREFRADRRGRSGRDPGHRGRRAVQRKPSSASCSRWRARASANLVALQKRRAEAVIRLPPETSSSSPATIRARCARSTSCSRPTASTAIGAPDLGLPEPEETGNDLRRQRAAQGRRRVAASRLAALADDSGLCVAALDGAPGIYSARWAGPAKDFRIAMTRVERRCANGNPDQRAHFRLRARARRAGRRDAKSSRARSTARSTFPPRGDTGFGYDPIFMPEGHRFTFGEMDPAAKHAI